MPQSKMQENSNPPATPPPFFSLGESEQNMIVKYAFLSPGEEVNLTSHSLEDNEIGGH